MKMNPYLNFNGQCAEAFKLYEQALGGKIEMMSTFGESPMAEHTPPEFHSRVMHVRMTVGDTVLMGSDSPPEHFEKPQGISIAIHVDDPEKADRIFDALAEGGTVTMALEQTFWARRFGMLVDRFGISWMINVE
jgi:PhnB protein